ncbi:MAG: serine/threonine protein kinase [Desulfamplus sp.]|nr:serine/threonine protein kinase [Desulfamplus sp.]
MHRNMLKPGCQCSTLSGSTYNITAFLGGGGQGEVYCAKSKDDHRDVAIKYYFPHQANDQQRKRIETLISSGPPSELFIWPEAVVTSVGEGINSWGYVMPLRDKRFKGFNELMRGDIPLSLKTKLTICYNMACAFHALHTKGLCYSDISFGNGFFDPSNGDFVAIDNDNVTINNDSEYQGVLGTPDFMAPEVIRGQVKTSQLTDLHSLAVLIFYILMISHPLYGKRLLSIHCLDLHARNLLCGANPLFIFDPVDQTNRALPDEDDPYGECGCNALFFWPQIPKEIQSLFMKTFTVGLNDPNQRARTSEWRKALIEARDKLFYCSRCAWESTYIDDQVGNSAGTCLRCGARLQSPLKLIFESKPKHPVMLNHDTRLYYHHISDKTWDIQNSVAELNQHPKLKIWGLKNTSQRAWNVLFSDGKLQVIEPGRSCPIIPGAQIDFGHKRRATIV